MAARPSWEKWMSWAADIWSTVGSGTFQVGNISHRILNTAHQFVIGDELAMNAMYCAPTNSIFLLLEDLRPTINQPSELAYEVWNQSQLEVDRLANHCNDAGYPYAVLQVPQLDNAHIIECALYWVHSLLLLNALRGIDPLSLDGSDIWRNTESAQSEAL